MNLPAHSASYSPAGKSPHWRWNAKPETASSASVYFPSRKAWIICSRCSSSSFMSLRWKSVDLTTRYKHHNHWTKLLCPNRTKSHDRSQDFVCQNDGQTCLVGHLPKQSRVGLSQFAVWMFVLCSSVLLERELVRLALLSDSVMERSAQMRQHTVVIILLCSCFFDTLFP